MILRVVLPVLAALFLTACSETTAPSSKTASNAAATTPSDENISRLARDFETVAFFQSETAINSTPVRWTPIAEPARVAVSVEDFMTPAQQRSSRERATRAIAALQSAGVGITESQSQATFTIINTDQRYYRELAAIVNSVAAPGIAQQTMASMRTGGCAILPIERGSKHVGGLLLVDVQRSESDQTNCVVVGLAHFVGLRGSLASNSAAFSATLPAAGFSERDLEIVRMGYDPRLRPGMSLADARPLLPEIAADALAR